MVATRNHPADFQDEPVLVESPTKRSTRTSTAAPTASPTKAAFATRSSRGASSTTSTSAQSAWSHTPSNLSLLWLAVSLPLVIWDTGYILLRPYSMPGGALHAPIWTPYKLYGEVDYVYGFKAYETRHGWPGTQSWFNVLETLGYFAYLYVVYTYGVTDERPGRGAPEPDAMPSGLRGLAQSRTVQGRAAAAVVLLGYSVISLTFFKTIMYMLIEVCSGFDNIGHNSWSRLVFLYLIPNGAWILVPGYLMYVLGQEILQEGVEGGRRGSDVRLASVFRNLRTLGHARSRSRSDFSRWPRVSLCVYMYVYATEVFFGYGKNGVAFDRFMSIQPVEARPALCDDAHRHRIPSVAASRPRAKSSSRRYVRPDRGPRPQSAMPCSVSMYAEPVVTSSERGSWNTRQEALDGGLACTSSTSALLRLTVATTGWYAPPSSCGMIPCPGRYSLIKQWFTPCGALAKMERREKRGMMGSVSQGGRGEARRVLVPVRRAGIACRRRCAREIQRLGGIWLGVSIVLLMCLRWIGAYERRLGVKLLRLRR
nr:hypothetical protein CFP56_65248 [Quercus suber]